MFRFIYIAVFGALNSFATSEHSSQVMSGNQTQISNFSSFEIINKYGAKKYPNDDYPKFSDSIYKKCNESIKSSNGKYIDKVSGIQIPETYMMPYKMVNVICKKWYQNHPNKLEISAYSSYRKLSEHIIGYCDTEIINFFDLIKWNSLKSILSSVKDTRLLAEFAYERDVPPTPIDNTDVKTLSHKEHVKYMVGESKIKEVEPTKIHTIKLGGQFANDIMKVFNQISKFTKEMYNIHMSYFYLMPPITIARNASNLQSMLNINCDICNNQSLPYIMIVGYIDYCEPDFTDSQYKILFKNISKDQYYEYCYKDVSLVDDLNKEIKYIAFMLFTAKFNGLSTYLDGAFSMHNVQMLMHSRNKEIAHFKEYSNTIDSTNTQILRDLKSQNSEHLEQEIDKQKHNNANVIDSYNEVINLNSKILSIPIEHYEFMICSTSSLLKIFEGSSVIIKKSILFSAIQLQHDNVAIYKRENVQRFHYAKPDVLDRDAWIESVMDKVTNKVEGIFVI